MQFPTSFITLILFLSLLQNCNSRKSNCVFIENHSRKVEIVDLDSACNYASKLNNAIPLYIYVDDSIPTDALVKFYHFSSLKKQSVMDYAVLFLAAQKQFIVVYSENMKTDSFRIKRYSFGRFVNEDLQGSKSQLELTPIYRKFAEIFSRRP